MNGTDSNRSPGYFDRLLRRYMRHLGNSPFLRTLWGRQINEDDLQEAGQRRDARRRENQPEIVIRQNIDRAGRNRVDVPVVAVVVNDPGAQLFEDRDHALLESVQAPLNQVPVSGIPEMVQVLADHCDCLRRPLDEYRVGRPSGKRLDPQRAAPRKQVQHSAPLDISEAGEEGLAHPVRGRPHAGRWG